MRFIDDFLAESHRRVLVIGGAGFDPRSMSVSVEDCSTAWEQE